MQDFFARGMQKLSGDDDNHSAPLFVGSNLEINQDRDQISTFGVHDKPCFANSTSTASINEPNTEKYIPSGTTGEENKGHRIADPSARCVYAGVLL